MWAKIKFYAIAAAGIAATVFFAVVQIFNAGKKNAQVESIQAGQKQEDSHRANLDKADAARNDHARTGGVPIDSDPNNRTNRGNGKI